MSGKKNTFQNTVLVNHAMLPDPQYSSRIGANFGPILNMNPMPDPRKTHIGPTGCQTEGSLFVQPGMPYIAGGSYAVGTDRVILAASIPYGQVDRYTAAINAAKTSGCKCKK